MASRRRRCERRSSTSEPPAIQLVATQPPLGDGAAAEASRLAERPPSTSWTNAKRPCAISSAAATISGAMSSAGAIGCLSSWPATAALISPAGTGAGPTGGGSGSSASSCRRCSGPSRRPCSPSNRRWPGRPSSTRNSRSSPPPRLSRAGGNAPVLPRHRHPVGDHPPGRDRGLPALPAPAPTHGLPRPRAERALLGRDPAPRRADQGRQQSRRRVLVEAAWHYRHRPAIGPRSPPGATGNRTRSSATRGGPTAFASPLPPSRRPRQALRWPWPRWPRTRGLSGRNDSA